MTHPLNHNSSTAASPSQASGLSSEQASCLPLAQSPISCPVGTATLNQPTRLLVSVRNIDEAKAAIAGGVDLLDMKEPTLGALGSVDPSIAYDICKLADDTIPTSMAIGELVGWVHQTQIDLPWATLLPGRLLKKLHYVKIGLAGALGLDDWQTSLADAFEQLKPACPIAVAYADHAHVNAPPIQAVLDWAIEHRAEGLLIDTACKTGQTLLDHLGLDALGDWIKLAHQHNLLIALAGSLRGSAFAEVLSLHPDILAIRSGACENHHRLGPVQQHRVEALVQQIKAHHRPTNSNEKETQ